MLKSLSIQNYALIEKLDISLSDYFNIITGETGAGKSILLGAIGMLTGNRADMKVLFNDTQNCVVEGFFELKSPHLKEIFEEAEIEYDDICFIRRLINPSGKSRAFINDTPVNLDVLRKIGTKLMDIHSQHDTMLLGSNEYQLSILDAFAQNQVVKEKYQKTYTAFRKAEKNYQKLIQEAASLQKEFEFNKYLFQELEKAQLDDIQQDTIEKDLEKIENIEVIRQYLHTAFTGLNSSEMSVENLMHDITHAVSKTASFGENYKQLHERLRSTFIELKDIASEIESEMEDLNFDEEEANKLRQTLNMVYTLQKKHQVNSVEELIDLRNQLEHKVCRVQNFDDEIENAKIELLRHEKMMFEDAKVLTASRYAVIPEIESEINRLLSYLGMPFARLVVQLIEQQPSSNGVDFASFLFSANKGVAPQTLKDAASGGEFSRLMLCIKYLLADKIELPTVIFDEIDTGISGEVAMKVGNILAEMAQKHQLIAISHLPQIAAKGDTHFFVYKDPSAERTISRIKKLSENERIEEIAQMIGGANPAPNIYESARELLKKVKEVV